MIAVVPPLSVERLASAVVPPTTPLNVVVPLVVTASDCPPSTVLENVAPAVPVDTVVDAVRNTFPNVAKSSLVPIVPARFVTDGATLVSPPLNVRTSPDPSPSVTTPVFWNVTASVIVTFDPVNDTSYDSPVVTRPPSVASPRNFTAEPDPARTVTAPPLVAAPVYVWFPTVRTVVPPARSDVPDTDSDSSDVVTPTDASVTRFPVTERLSVPNFVPSTVLLNRTEPTSTPDVVDNTMSPVSVTAFSNNTSPPSVVTSPAVEMPLAPRSVTAVPLALLEVMSPAAASVSTVPASTVTAPTALIAASTVTVVAVPVRPTVEPPSMDCLTATLVAAVTDTAPVATMPERADCGVTARILPIVRSSAS